MFTQNSHDAKLDQEITVALEELAALRDDPKKYADVLDRIDKLEKLKTRKGISPPSMDTLVIAATNIFGVLWVARFEREHVIPKSLGQVLKVK